MNPVRVALPLVMLFGLFFLTASADYLTNTDFKDSLGGWHGDGKRVLLLPDGTEGSETDTDAVPVIKLKLTSRPEAVYQNYHVSELPPSVHVTIDAYASSDFKRGKFASNAAFGSEISDGSYVPDADFWFREDPSYSIETLKIKTGQWFTLAGIVEYSEAVTERFIYFCVPPGEGAIYLKNPHITR